MRKLIFNFLIFQAFFSKGQTVSIADIDFQPTDTLKGSYVVHSSKPHIFIASAFGNDVVSQNSLLDSISGFMIKEIVLVYSRYHKSENFNQIKLNNGRWSNLIKNYPSLFHNGITTYKNVCQDVEVDTAAKKLSHGFYIYFENRSDSAKRETEILEISKMLTALGIDTSDVTTETTSSSSEIIPFTEVEKKPSKFGIPMRTIDPKACRQPFYQKDLKDLNQFFKEQIVLSTKQKRKPKELEAEVRLRLDYRGFIKNAYILAVNKALVEQIRKALYNMEPWNPAIRNGITVKSDVKFILHYSPDGTMALKGGIIVAPFLAKCGTASDEELFDFSKKDVKEKKLSATFEVEDNSIVRHVVTRQPSLDSLLLVVDLTGSMGPYIAQVLDLMADLVINGTPHVSCITLFNDGDSKKDKNKVIGRTDGIIILERDITLDKLGNAILRSMKNGSGGDCMENNIEAVIKGMEKCKDCRDIVMVADNFATPRDGSLLTSVNKPIHWILCGASEGINVNYLDLIRLNKGFLHTDKSDFITLHLLKENEIITIDGFSYQLTRGKFKFARTP